MNKSQEAFLRKEFFQLSLRATAQRASIYASDAAEGARRAFRDILRRELDQESQRYHEAVDDEHHVQAVVRVAKRLSDAHPATLRDGRFRLGPAQKALNLYLKYLWCAGLAHEPPHCPFDSIVIQQLPSTVAVKWTQLDEIEDYLRLVRAARAESESESLARWELRLYAHLTSGDAGDVDGTTQTS